jgi:hypothetical protein
VEKPEKHTIISVTDIEGECTVEVMIFIRVECDSYVA